MTIASSTVTRPPRPSGLADVLELILDKGLVIDAYVRVSLVGIELLTIDARVVVASVDTYLRFAQATSRLDLRNSDDSEGLPQLVGDLTEKGSSHKVKGALSGAADEVSGWLHGDDDSDEREPARSNGRRERPSRREDNGRQRSARPAKSSRSRSERARDDEED